jgi:hypothetical protein
MAWGTPSGSFGRAVEHIATVNPGLFARGDVLVRDGSLEEGKGFIIPGDEIGAVGLDGHRGRVGEHVAGHLLLDIERHQLSRERGMACHAEPCRGEEQGEGETGLAHKVYYTANKVAGSFASSAARAPPFAPSNASGGAGEMAAAGVGAIRAPWASRSGV